MEEKEVLKIEGHRASQLFGLNGVLMDVNQTCLPLWFVVKCLIYCVFIGLVLDEDRRYLYKFSFECFIKPNLGT